MGELSETSKTEKDKYCMISLICVILKSQTCFLKKEIKMVVTREWGIGGKTDGMSGYKFIMSSK